MRNRGVLAGLVLLLSLAIPGKSCGPYFLQLTFVDPDRPEDLDAFVSGTPFAIQPTWRVRSLALAYRLMTGPALTQQEQKSVSEMNDRESGYEDPAKAPPAEGQTAWQTVYKAFAGIDPDLPGNTRPNPAQSWETYLVCPDATYAYAATTFTQRQRQHPTAKADLTEWLNGQTAVYSNCSGPGADPATLPPTSPLWLQQDRAYQLAAAHFYRTEWQPALAAFTAIQADSASPWHQLAAYMLGRTLIRQATLAAPTDKTYDPATLANAEKQLQIVAAQHTEWSEPAAELLNFIDLRLHVGTAAARLGNTIAQPDPRLGQHLVDLRFAFESSSLQSNDALRTEGSQSDLVDWILTAQSGNRDPRHAAARFRATKSPAWLLLALESAANTKAQPEPDLLAAAQALPTTSPAWPSVEYARLTTLPNTPATFQIIVKDRETLVAQSAFTSAVNQFTQLALSLAPTLEEYIRLAPLDPAGENDDDNDYSPFFLPANLRNQPSRRPADPQNPSPGNVKLPTMAGLPVNSPGVKRLDEDSAKIINQRLPLSTLVPLALNAPWPKQLKFELAQAVWTRAVLLNQPEQAARLTPLMIESEPGWKPWLTAYDAATTPEERDATALLALLRFPSVRPYINANAGREEGFVGYSSYRDNWWCASLDQPQYPVTQPPIPVRPLPYVSPAMATQAADERQQLSKIGDAPAYFGNLTLAFVKAHPTNPHNPELLGFAFRAMRNGCNLEDSTTQRKQIWQLLQTRYPTTTWAKRYPTFTSDIE